MSIKMCFVCIYWGPRSVALLHHTHKRCDIKLSQSIKHVLCAEILIDPVIWKPQENPKNFPIPQSPLLVHSSFFIVDKDLLLWVSERRMRRKFELLWKGFVCRFVVLKSSSDEINDFSSNRLQPTNIWIHFTSLLELCRWTLDVPPQLLQLKK